MNKIQQRLLALSILLTGLGLYSPVYQQIYEKSQKLLVKPCRKHSETQSAQPKLNLILGDYSSDQWQSQTQPPRQLADRAEVIFVSGYEPERNLDRGKVKVKVDRPYQKVLLVLSSYEGINWQVEASANTQIAGILYNSYHPSTIITSLDSTEVFPVELPYSYETANKNFVAALQQLNRWFDVQGVDGFRGHYYLPGEIEISQLDASDPSLTLAGYPIEKSTNNSKFVFYDRNYEPIELTTKEINNKSQKLASIVGQRGVAISPNHQQIYEITDKGIKISDRASGKQQICDLPDDFPQLSWATDIAYDSKRDLVSLVSFGGEGYFYRFDVKSRRWLDVRSLNGIDLQSLAYDPMSDRYVAWEESYIGDKGNLWFISSSGELQSQENIGSRLKEYYLLYDRGNGGSSPEVEIVANGNDIALIARQNPYWRDNWDSPIAAIWHYDRNANTVKLSYKRQKNFYLYSD